MNLPAEIPQGLEDGRVRDLLALTDADFSVEEIAARLARINRFAGATHWPYSVALHSVLVSHLCAHSTSYEDWRLAGLLHDIPEAFGIGDLITPIKRLVTGYRELEDALVTQLCVPFPALTLHASEEVRWADERAYQLECLFLRGAWPRPEHTRFAALAPDSLEYQLGRKYLISEWNWRDARDEFVHRYEELNHG